MDVTNVGYHFGVLNRRSQAYITQACKPLGLTYSEYVLLFELCQRDGCSQDELAKRLTADKGLVARNSKTLEEKGFITRAADASDKRMRRLVVTPKGQALKRTLTEILQCWVDEITAGMDTAKLDMAFTLMEDVAKRASQLDITTIYQERKDRK